MAAQKGGYYLPPLFNCAISEAVDLFNADPAANCFGYADDIKLLRIGNNLAEMGHLIQQDINKLMTWACHNNLRFNPDKTKAMIFSRKQKLLGKPELIVDGRAIEYVDTFKYLGVTFDSKMLWTTHINDHGLQKHGWKILGTLSKKRT